MCRLMGLEYSVQPTAGGHPLVTLVPRRPLVGLKPTRGSHLFSDKSHCFSSDFAPCFKTVCMTMGVSDRVPTTDFGRVERAE